MSEASSARESGETSPAPGAAGGASTTGESGTRTTRGWGGRPKGVSPWGTPARPGEPTTVLHHLPGYPRQGFPQLGRPEARRMAKSAHRTGDLAGCRWGMEGVERPSPDREREIGKGEAATRRWRRPGPGSVPGPARPGRRTGPAG